MECGRQTKRWEKPLFGKRKRKNANDSPQRRQPSVASDLNTQASPHVTVPQLPISVCCDLGSHCLLGCCENHSTRAGCAPFYSWCTSTHKEQTKGPQHRVEPGEWDSQAQGMSVLQLITVHLSAVYSLVHRAHHPWVPQHLHQGLQ